MGKIIDRVRERCKRAAEVRERLFKEELNREWKEADIAHKKKLRAEVLDIDLKNKAFNLGIILNYSWWERFKYHYLTKDRRLIYLNEYQQYILDYYDYL
ncbi:hypothetical protein UFOVP273_113 [uncultured Caudovirales phage]|uniref:Uncharacterized protein n=1 Tax=uncultured Caudovirales phage TaxID=2100421 RepID=A0A6J5LIU4_9CAUD|nr:hypothetical protein UFOVP273_113 [uncultured Caudovirales phage]